MDKKQLIETIRRTMPKLDESDPDKELKIALHIYITIGKQKAFDEKYYFGDSETAKKIEQLAKRSIRHPEEFVPKRKIVCISISYLYKDILREFGINASVIKPDNEDKHVLPVIKLKDGRKIKADIQQDLYLIQTKSRLKNITSVRSPFGDKELTPEQLTKILIDIGYIKDEKEYRDEKIEEVKKEISYKDAQEALSKILEDKRICEIEDELGYVEATKYYKSILNIIVPQYLDKKIFKVDCYREKENKEKDYSICLYAEERGEIKPYIFSNKLNRFVKTDLEQLNQWQKEGLVIGIGHKRDGSKKLKKYIKKQEKTKKQGVIQE